MSSRSDFFVFFCGAARDRCGMAALVIVGAGPRGVGILERIAANAPELAAGLPLTIHLVDPHPPGGGRIWRFDQSPLLKLNSMAQDVTMFTDASSTIDGPVRHGPSLVDWARAVRSGGLRIDTSDAVRTEIDGLGGTSFPTRRLQSAYLEWFYRSAVAALPDSAEVVEHAASVVEVRDEGDAQLVRLDSGELIVADAVVYALGHTGSLPEPEHVALGDFARVHGLEYMGPGYTADVDTAGLRAGETVIVRGMGLAAVDLVVLLTEGRGGRFVPGSAGLDYLPSGREPHLVLGSRRGVPYHSKISSTLAAPRVEPRFFTAAIAAELAERPGLGFREHVWPLIAKEVLWGYYHELFVGHPERVTMPWEVFAELFAPLDPFGPHLAKLVDRTVTHELDRLDLRTFDRPLEGRRFADHDSLQEAVRDYIERDLHVRSAPEHSATLALFTSLLFALFDLGAIVDSAQWTARARVTELASWWPNLFSYIASGPPAHRLHELLALSRAGVVEFLGAETWVDPDSDGAFLAGSASVAHTVRARALVDARLPGPTISRTDNPALRSLLATGAGCEEWVADADFSGSTGRLRVSRADSRVIDAAGIPHPRRFAVGAFTNAPFVGAFSRPGTNAVSFRENDRVARTLLQSLRSHASGERDLDDLREETPAFEVV